jgi:hypothetical protein
MTFQSPVCERELLSTRPSGSPLPNSLRANIWLMTMVPGFVGDSKSALVNVLPAKSGICIVSKSLARHPEGLQSEPRKFEAAFARFVGAIPLTTTNRSCCLFLSMSSCAASCCSPKVSCASVTSAFWPTDDVPPPCHFVSSYWARNRQPNKRPPPPMTQVLSRAAPNAADR